MYLIVIAWLYVALMMAVAEATHANGSVLGAVITFFLYGVAPLALAMYLLGTPGRRRARREAEAREDAERAAAAVAVAGGSPDREHPLPPAPSGGLSLDPDGGRHASALAEDGPVAPVRKEA